MNEAQNQHYSPVSKLLHWSIALFVIIQIPLGVYMVTLSNEDIWYYRCLDLHQLIGVSLLMLVAASILWRFVTPTPKALPTITRIQNAAAKTTHVTLSLILLIQPLLGYLFVTAWGDPLEIYAILKIPAITELNKDTSEKVIDIHAYLAYTLATLGAIHVIASLKHHYIHKNLILKRMLPRNKN